jgi:hypothetical protein
VSCKTACVSRLDCGTRYDDCDGTIGSCHPDAVSSAASAKGITPVTWTPPRLLKPDEVRDKLVDAGLPQDDAGRILLPSSFAGVQVAYDPSLQTPLTGVKSCLQRIRTCTGLTGEIDECVADAPRCASTEPWLGDPAGDDCCPVSCLLSYFDARPAKDEPTALKAFLDNGCYPGLSAYLNSGALP